MANFEREPQKNLREEWEKEVARLEGELNKILEIRGRIDKGIEEAKKIKTPKSEQILKEFLDFAAEIDQRVGEYAAKHELAVQALKNLGNAERVLNEACKEVKTGHKKGDWISGLEKQKSDFEDLVKHYKVKLENAMKKLSDAQLIGDANLKALAEIEINETSVELQALEVGVKLVTERLAGVNKAKSEIDEAIRKAGNEPKEGPETG